MNMLRGVILTSALLISAQSQAALVSGNAEFGDFNIQTSGTANFEFTGINYFIASTEVNVSSPYFSEDFHSNQSPGAATANSSAANGDTFAAADANIFPVSYAEVDGAGNAASNSLAELGYEVSGVGQVTVSFDVALFADILGPTGSESVEVITAITDSFGGVDVIDLLFFGEDGDIAYTDFTTLSLTFDVDGFSQDILSLETRALALSGVNPVPVPAAAWLFMSGLLGLAGTARNKN